jgi:UDP-N-acetylmuramate dehydrogenase
MLNFKEAQSLKAYNTFGIDAKAKLFISVESVEAIKALIQSETYQQNQVLWLGGGSNMLLTKDFDGLVVKLDLKGITHEYLNEDTVSLSVMAGENWHELVIYTLEQNWGGLENLSLIPGNTGTAPIQNIGAYGVELKDSFHSLAAFNLESGTTENFSKTQCAFGYRDSFFKRNGKGKYVITKVNFQLSRKNHRLHTSYGAITTALNEMDLSPSIQNISRAVIQIRQSKLPDPKEIGNSGSFFKNPVVTKAFAEDLVQQFPEMPNYPLNEKETKLAAGWLIEQCGLKGYRKGDAGVHVKQALVLVNYDNADGKDILDIAQHVKRTVFDKFAVSLEAEVNLI